MSNNNNHQLGEAPWLHVVISTGFGVGFWPWGPGTLGGFVALLIWIALYFTLSPIWLAVATVLLVLTTLLVGVWTDVAISLATIGFVLFRIIDITKPLGCRWVDRHIHGGWGCMLDDALAGFYALCLTLIIRYAGLVESVHDLLS